MTLNTLVEFKPKKPIRVSNRKVAPTHFMGFKFPKFRPEEDPIFDAGLRFQKAVI